GQASLGPRDRLGRAAGHRDRPGPGVRDGKPRHHARLPGADARPAAGGLVRDVGCGSGVLAIAAARLGWSPVRALDLEPEAVRAARANSRANRADVEVRRFDLRREPPPPADTIAANLLPPPLLDLATS